ncbi:uncharacterized protein ACN427_010781 isoform 2-T2 [Glossina fuscipes fuscipes]
MGKIIGQNPVVMRNPGVIDVPHKNDMPSTDKKRNCKNEGKERKELFDTHNLLPKQIDNRRRFQKTIQQLLREKIGKIMQTSILVWFYINKRIQFENAEDMPVLISLLIDLS